MVTVIPFLSPLLRLIKTPEGAIFAHSRVYLLWLLAGLPVSAINNVVTAELRAFGDSLTPTIFLIVSAVVNIGLNVACIVFLSMGVEGVAIATVASQLVSGVGAYLYCYRKFPQLAPPWHEWRNLARTYWAHLRVALPMALQFMGTAVGFVLLQSALNILGKNAINAYTVGCKTEQFLGTPMAAFGMAVSTFVAQNYGAGLYDRIRGGMRQITVFSLSATAVICVMMVLGARLSVDLLMEGAPGALYADVSLYLKISAALYFFLSLIYIHRNALQGMGRAIVPLFSGVMELIARVLCSLFVIHTVKTTIETYGTLNPLEALAGQADAVAACAHRAFLGVAFTNPLAWVASELLLVAFFFLAMRDLKRMSVSGSLPGDRPSRS